MDVNEDSVGRLLKRSWDLVRTYWPSTRAMIDFHIEYD